MSSLTMAASPTLSAKPPALLWPASAVGTVVLFFGIPGAGGERVDLWFQSLFWNGHQWLIPHENALGRTLAYDGPKAVIIALAVSLIVFAVIFPRVRIRALYLLACLAVVSVICTQLRAISGMATPIELKAFGGTYDHLLLFQSKPAGYPSHAFPAGHASGGFALLGFYWVLDSRRRWQGLTLGLGVGCWMGIYQIGRGEHFLSHTLATAALAWFLCAGLYRLMQGPLGREVSSSS